MVSIIEQETKIVTGQDSSELINRIQLDMKLQADSTVICWMGKNYFGDIYHVRKDLIMLTP